MNVGPKAAGLEPGPGEPTSPQFKGLHRSHLRPELIVGFVTSCSSGQICPVSRRKRPSTWTRLHVGKPCEPARVPWSAETMLVIRHGLERWPASSKGDFARSRPWHTCRNSAQSPRVPLAACTRWPAKALFARFLCLGGLYERWGGEADDRNQTPGHRRGLVQGGR